MPPSRKIWPPKVGRPRQYSMRRLIRLAKPRQYAGYPPTVKYDPRKLKRPKRSLKPYKSSTRIEKLAIPRKPVKKLKDRKTDGVSHFFKVKPAALKAEATPRINSLSQPRHKTEKYEKEN